MVGVPFLLRRCDAGPSGRIGCPLPCFKRNAEMIVGPKKKTRKSPVPAAPSVRNVRYRNRWKAPGSSASQVSMS